MTDRELLELAAKAAGMHLTLAGYIKNGDEGNPVYSHPDYKWNPLADDGDALRLAVKLKIDIVHALEIDIVHAFAIRTAVGKGKLTAGYSADGKDGYAATRRAIVRAAAEIGSAMR